MWWSLQCGSEGPEAGQELERGRTGAGGDGGGGVAGGARPWSDSTGWTGQDSAGGTSAARPCHRRSGHRNKHKG